MASKILTDELPHPLQPGARPAPLASALCGLLCAALHVACDAPPCMWPLTRCPACEGAVSAQLSRSAPCSHASTCAQLTEERYAAASTVRALILPYPMARRRDDRERQRHPQPVLLRGVHPDPGQRAAERRRAGQQLLEPVHGRHRRRRPLPGHAGRHEHHGRHRRARAAPRPRAGSL